MGRELTFTRIPFPAAKEPPMGVSTDGPSESSQNNLSTRDRVNLRSRAPMVNQM